MVVACAMGVAVVVAAGGGHALVIHSLHQGVLVWFPVGILTRCLAHYWVCKLKCLTSLLQSFANYSHPSRWCSFLGIPSGASTCPLV